MHLFINRKNKRTWALDTTSQVNINPPAEPLADSISKMLDPWVVQCRKILSFRSSVLLLDDIKMYYKPNTFAKIVIISLQIKFFFTSKFTPTKTLPTHKNHRPMALETSHVKQHGKRVNFQH